MLASDSRVGLRPEFLHGNQGEDQGRQAAGPEPADERHRSPVETCADQGESNGEHPHQGEAEHRLHHDGHAHAVEHDRDRDYAERDPHEQGDQAAGLLEEDNLRGSTPPGRGPNANPPQNAATNPFPPTVTAPR
jgi:hypothetical protein